MAYKTSFLGLCALLVLSSPARAEYTCSSQVPVTTYYPAAVTSSGDYSDGYASWFAFDGSPTSMWISSTFQSQVWIGYQLSSPTRVDRYAIHFSNGSLTSRAPRNFELQALSNGTWITVDSRTNQTDWLGTEKRTFTVSQPGYYSQYRLLVSDDNDSAAGIVVISITELELYGCGCTSTAELLPKLTGNTAAVTQSGAYSGTYPAWQAFDGSTGSMWISAEGQTPAWIGYEWSTPRFVSSYALTYTNGTITSRAPKDWQLQGWNGASWTTVDSRANETNWSGNETRNYVVQAPGSYTKYRLLVSDDNDTRAGVVVISLGNLSFGGCESNTFTAASLHGTWHEDYDQSVGDIQHFVPTSVPLEDLRFRDEIYFYAGGTGKFYRLAPNDGHYLVDTTWTLNGNRVTVTFTDNRWTSTAGTYDYVYELVSASPSDLLLKRISVTKR